jgi:hypothetical protein
LKFFENGIVGLDGKSGEKVVIVGVLNALLVNNPRQSDLCSHKGMK